LEFFEELRKIRVSGRTPKSVKPRIARWFAWDCHVDHFGSGQPVPEGLSDLGDGFRFGRCHHFDFRDTQWLGYILMRRFRSNDDRIVHGILFYAKDRRL
jgi:hypothetical protein